jgi:hypothetical protein
MGNRSSVTLHDTTSCLRVLTAGFALPTPSIPPAGDLFPMQLRMGATTRAQDFGPAPSIPQVLRLRPVVECCALKLGRTSSLIGAGGIGSRDHQDFAALRHCQNSPWRGSTGGRNETLKEARFGGPLDPGPGPRRPAPPPPRPAGLFGMDQAPVRLASLSWRKLVSRRVTTPRRADSGPAGSSAVQPRGHRGAGE